MINIERERNQSQEAIPTRKEKDPEVVVIISGKRAIREVKTDQGKGRGESTESIDIEEGEEEIQDQDLDLSIEEGMTVIVLIVEGNDHLLRLKSDSLLVISSV